METNEFGNAGPEVTEIVTLGLPMYTNRLTEYVKFRDNNQCKCSLRQSEDDPNLVSLNCDSSQVSRIVLTRREVVGLVNHLQAWLKSGSFMPLPDGCDRLVEGD